VPIKNNKRNTSVRLNANDRVKVEGVARRLNVSESNLIRFCIKNTLNRMAPLDDHSYVGADLVPALLDIGQDLTRYFELNSLQMRTIVNGDSVGSEDTDSSVSGADLDLFTLAAWNENSVLHRLNEMAGELQLEVGTASDFLHNYLFEKYVLVDRRCGED